MGRKAVHGISHPTPSATVTISSLAPFTLQTFIELTDITSRTLTRLDEGVSLILLGQRNVNWLMNSGISQVSAEWTSVLDAKGINGSLWSLLGDNRPTKWKSHFAGKAKTSGDSKSKSALRKLKLVGKACPGRISYGWGLLTSSIRYRWLRHTLFRIADALWK